MAGGGAGSCLIVGRRGGGGGECRRWPPGIWRPPVASCPGATRLGKLDGAAGRTSRRPRRACRRCCRSEDGLVGGAAGPGSRKEGRMGRRPRRRCCRSRIAEGREDGEIVGGALLLRARVSAGWVGGVSFLFPFSLSLFLLALRGLPVQIFESEYKTEKSWAGKQ
jgi:hypothetical protein